VAVSSWFLGKVSVRRVGTAFSDHSRDGRRIREESGCLKAQVASGPDAGMGMPRCPHRGQEKEPTDASAR
jgi:hypothetical protein